MNATNIIIFVIGSLICSTMLCLIWLIVEKSWDLLFRTEKPLEGNSESGNTEEEGEKFPCKLNKTSPDKIVLERHLHGISRIDADLKHLTNYRIKTNTKNKGAGCHKLSKKNVLRTSNSQSFQPPVSLPVTQNESEFKETFKASERKQIIEPITLLFEENKTIILHINKKLPLIWVAEEENQALSFVKKLNRFYSQLQDKISFKSLVLYKENNKQNKTNCLIIKRDKLNWLQFIAKCLVDCFQFVDNVRYEKPMLFKDYKTLKNNDNYDGKSVITLEVQKNEKLTHISFIETDFLEDDIVMEQMNICLCNANYKCSKFTKKKRYLRGKSQSNYFVGHSKKYFKTRSFSYSNIKLVAEIERHLKPIKYQIEEIRRSVCDFHMQNWNYKTTKSIFSSKPVNLAPSDSTISFPLNLSGYISNPTIYLYEDCQTQQEIKSQLKPTKDQVEEVQLSIIKSNGENLNYKRAKSLSTVTLPSNLSNYNHVYENQFSFLNPCCLEEYLLLREPKNLCPLAEMYIKLSKI